MGAQKGYKQKFVGSEASKDTCSSGFVFKELAKSTLSSCFKSRDLPPNFFAPGRPGFDSRIRISLFNSTRYLTPGERVLGGEESA